MWLNKIKELENEYQRVLNNGKKSNYKRKCRITELKCDNCDSIFERPLNLLSPNRRNNNVKHFCSKCDSYALGGKIASEIRTEKYNNLIGKTNKYNRGYVEIYVKGTHEHRPDENWIREHIIVMENHIGRKLKKGEVVHHIDGDKHNNNISNLDLCTIEEHNNCHAKSELIVFELYKKGLVGYDTNQKKYFVV